ncbi:hypothetical protein Salat_2621200 [Sesamum alatum]|uniref:Uncharacterized protein n=1 Tax=Sesamum alatum TaxID=300844 RepID=A0AAE1XNI9_9LAMI|nr:hypothetical protein Salat_2621200 [Sesamum alatum]
MTHRQGHTPIDSSSHDEYFHMPQLRFNRFFRRTPNRAPASVLLLIRRFTNDPASETTVVRFLALCRVDRYPPRSFSSVLGKWFFLVVLILGVFFCTRYLDSIVAFPIQYHQPESIRPNGTHHHFSLWAC